MANASDAVSTKVRGGEYQIVNTTQGQVIEMEGFGYLMVPGKPMLPAKNFLIALPPGARVRSVEVKGIGAKLLPGTYQIMPTPPIMPLADPHQYQELVEEMRLEWERNTQAVYSSDQAYPKERGKLTSSGSLRKYSYASVSFYPFSYHPQSGRLIHYDAAQINVKYELPSPGSVEAEEMEEFKWDTLADERASRLFVNYHQIKDLYQPTGPEPKAWQQTYDYVIITTSDLSSAITSSDFPDWKASLGYSVRFVLTTDSEITSQPGGDLAEKIRNFLRYNYIPWGIEYVLLVGDYVTIPMRYCYPGGSEVPTDYYYADLSHPDTASWDSDGDGVYGEYGQDSPDFLAEVSVGRIPTNNTSRITYTLNKLVAFEQDTGAWKNQALHAGAILAFANQDYSDLPLVDGCRSLHSIETDLMNGWMVSHYSEQAGLASSTCPWPALSEVTFTDDWRNGQYAVVNWAGHGSPSGAGRIVWFWDDGDGVPETHDPSEITHYAFISIYSDLEDDHPSIVFAISCNVGYPEPNVQGNLGIDLLTKPGFGSSVGVISATRGAAAAVYWDSVGGGAESMCYEFNRYMINGPNGPEKVGNALYDSKFYCNQNYAWDHYYEYMNMFGFNLYGDPSLAREGAVPLPRGDCNSDGTIDIGDVVYLVNYLYKDGSAPDPLLAGDCNCDATVDLGDVVYLINYLFRQGSPPGGC
ncbi:MAG: hypothetical protein KAW02_03215 [candidate division Zixibacteria bacterium]|nr:hypothetical protein [candidate division Zixibacteria bacterium]